MCIKQNSGLLHDVCIDIRFDILVDTEAAWPCLRFQYTTYVNICVEITYRCFIFYGSAKVKFNLQNNNYAPWFYTRNGLVQVMELNIDKRQKPERLRSVSNHLHRTVSCIHWDPSGQKLYTADNIGNVVVANIPSSKVTTGNAIRLNNWFNNNFVKCVKFWSIFLIISTW